MRTRAAATVSLAALLLAGTSAFSEDDRVLQSWSGQAGSQHGWAVATIDDLDGDGIDDVITSAPFEDAAGIAAPALVPRDGATYVYSSGSGDLLHRFAGLGLEQHGYAIADAGDVDGDGVHDVVAGAPGAAPGGVAYVHSGATGELLHVLRPTAGARGFFGAAVAGLGDVDGDGRSDVLVGDPNRNTATVHSGASGEVLVQARTDGTNEAFGAGTGATGDLDGDGIGDFVVGAPGAGNTNGRVAAFSSASGTQLWSFEGSALNANLGLFFVAGIGDVTGDGVDDVYGGDFAATHNGANAGSGHVLDGVDGTLVWEVFGAQSGHGLGPGRGAGDVTGDGIPDLVLGSYTAGGKGLVRVHDGRDGEPVRTISSAVAGEQLGFDAVGLDDVDGDGVIDLLLSAANGDTIYVVAG